MSGTIEVLSAEIRWAAKRLAVWLGLAGRGLLGVRTRE
jgi:hypothetical protein